MSIADYLVPDYPMVKLNPNDFIWNVGGWLHTSKDIAVSLSIMFCLLTGSLLYRSMTIPNICISVVIIIVSVIVVGFFCYEPPGTFDFLLRWTPFYRRTLIQSFYDTLLIALYEIYIYLSEYGKN